MIIEQYLSDAIKNIEEKAAQRKALDTINTLREEIRDLQKENQKLQTSRLLVIHDLEIERSNSLKSLDRMNKKLHLDEQQIEIL